MKKVEQDWPEKYLNEFCTNFLRISPENMFVRCVSLLYQSYMWSKHKLNESVENIPYFENLLGKTPPKAVFLFNQREIVITVHMCFPSLKVNTRESCKKIE